MSFSGPLPPKSNLARYRQLAPNASIRVSPICLGTMNFGEAWEGHMGKCSKDQTFEILDHYKDQGGNFIDTANVYHNEDTEIWLGEWMASRKNRDQLVLATKYSGDYKFYEPDMIHVNNGGNGSKSLRLSLEDSLKKLQTSYIDILFLHWWDFTVSIPEMMQSLNDLVTAGKVLYLGISDTPAWIVSRANQYARDNCLRPFTVYQGLWNAAIRDIERDVVPMCRSEGMGLMAFGALGQGRFQSEQTYKDREAGTDHEGRKAAPVDAADKAVAKVLEKLAKEKNTEITSVAMAFILSKTTYVFPLIGCRRIDHLKGNIRAMEISLSGSEVKEIETASNFNPGWPHTFLSHTSEAATGPQDVWLTKMSGNFDWVEAEKPIKAFTQ